MVRRPLDGSVDRRPSDREQLGELSTGVGSGVMERDQVCFLTGAELRLLASKSSTGARDLHPLASAHPDQVGFKFSDHRQYVEQQPPYGIGGIVDRAAEVELNGSMLGSVSPGVQSRARP